MYIGKLSHIKYFIPLNSTHRLSRSHKGRKELFQDIEGLKIAQWEN